MTASGTGPMAARDAYLRTTFLERVAHELRGPVGVSSGALDEIERAVAEGAETPHSYFLMARRGMKRLLRLAERLQRAAQLESGPIEWTKTRSDLRTLVSEAVEEIEPLEARRSVRVDTSCSDATCPVLVDADWTRLAIGEVVANAIRFAKTVVTVRTEPSGDQVKVTITDDGGGFTWADVPRFEPPPDARGVGLSLPFVSDVFAAHGGLLEIAGPSSSAEASSGGHVVLLLPRVLESQT